MTERKISINSDAEPARALDTSVKLFGRTLKNPIIPASGTFGFGWEFAEVYDINVLGSIALKGTTAEERYGNPLPRIAECPAGLINAVGLQNPGVRSVIEEELPKLDKVYSGKVIANVGGHSFDEYVAVSEAFDGCDKAFAIELNVSCPNVKEGGMAFGTDAKILEKLVKAVKKHVLKPVIVKLSPNVTDIVELAEAAEAGGADGLCLINTLLGMRIDLKSRKPVISVERGGCSGPGIFPIALRMIFDTARAVKIPVIGAGGVTNARNVVEMMLAGASAVQVGAQNLIEPLACKRIIEELPPLMDELKIEKLSAIIGQAL